MEWGMRWLGPGLGLGLSFTKTVSGVDDRV